MHIHCHLRDCVMDFGPISGFWLFPYERLNGILGELPSNNRSIEIQLMKRFLNDQSMRSISVPQEFSEVFGPLINFNSECVGSLKDNFNASPSATSNISWNIDELLGISITLPSHYVKGAFSASEVQNLKEFYSALYSTPVSDIYVYVNSIFHKYKSLTINGKVLGSLRSRSSSSCIVMCEWPLQLLDIVTLRNDSNCKCRPVQINYFAKHTILLKEKRLTHLLISTSWFKQHPEINRYGKPVTVWHYDLFESPGLLDIIPIQCVKCKTVSLVDKMDNYGSALLVCPCMDF